MLQTLGIQRESTINHKIFETKSRFHVQQCTTGRIQFLFFRRFFLVLTKFSFREEDQALGKKTMKFWDFPESFLSRLATRIYQFITNSHAWCYIWWTENLLNHQKVSKYYEHDLQVIRNFQWNPKMLFFHPFTRTLNKKWKICNIWKYGNRKKMEREWI